MSGDGIHAIGAFVAAIVGLAVVAVLVSNNANTSNVLTSGGTALSNIIQAAVAPVNNNSNNGVTL